MPRFLCSFPNDKHAPGRRPHIITDDPAKAEAFIQTWNRPGRGVFECISRLQPGATERNLQTVDDLPQLVTDQDLRAIEEPAEQVDSVNRSLPLLPTEIRNSGGGRHLVWMLHEPIERGTPEYNRAVAAMKRLAALLGGDPNPTHPAALLRVPGTLNSKYDGDPILVEAIGGSGQAVDLADIEEMLELLEQRVPLLTLKPPVRLNGKSPGRADPIPDRDRTQPLDVDQCLADMYWNGPHGNNNIHEVQLRVTGALTWRGEMVMDTVARVMEAVRLAIAHDPGTAGWDWIDEEADVTRMCTDAINDRPELVYTLPDAVREEFEDVLAEGREPLLQVSKLAKIFVKRGRGPNAKLSEEAKKGTASAGPGHQNARRVPAIEAKPFVWRDPATIPPREWLYGNHYQRGVCTATIGPGGGGKSSLNLVELLAMCTGRPLLGEHPTIRCKAWYHNAEDNRDEIDRRIAALCMHYGIDKSELGWLFVTSGIEMPIKIATARNGAVAVDAVTVDAIIRTVTDNEIVVASFDPLIAHHRTPASLPPVKKSLALSIAEAPARLSMRFGRLACSIPCPSRTPKKRASTTWTAACTSASIRVRPTWHPLRRRIGTNS